MRYPDSRLLVFSKAPEPGEVKTRLIGELGADGAAALHAGLVHHCLDIAVHAGLSPVELWCAPSTEHAFFQHCRQHFGIGLRQQSGHDLGQRMALALQSALVHSVHAVLIGTDCPALAREDLEEAFEALEHGADLVLGPALDGGYYLVGMSRCHACIFKGIPWGTSGVLEATRRQLRRDELECHFLRTHRDLDTPDDYRLHRESGTIPEIRDLATATGNFRI